MKVFAGFRIRQLALLAVPFAAAWTFAPRVTLEQFELPKHAALLILVAVSLAGAGGGGTMAFLRRQPALFALLMAVSLSTAAAPLTAGLGDHDNLSGAVTWWLYAALFAAGTRLSPGGRRRFAAAVVVAAAGSTMYGLAQQAGWDPFRGELFRHVRAAAGNPDFLAQQLAMALPLVLAPALLTGAWRRGFLLAALVLVLSLTGSRAGLAAALLASAWLAIRMHRRAWANAGRFRLAAGAAMLAIVAAELLIAPELSLRARLGALGGSGGLASSRGELWHGVAAAAVRRPLVGWGPDQLGSVFLAYAPPGWASREGLGETARNAHCEPLHLLATVGCLGLGAWIWLLAVAWRRWRDRPARVGEDAAMAACGAYLVHNLFSFGTAATSPVFWVLLGGLSRPATADVPRTSALSPAGMVLAVVLGAYAAIRLTADAYGFRGNEAERARRPELAAPAFAHAVRLAPWEPAFLIRRAWSLEALNRPAEALPWYERVAAMKPLEGIALGHVGRLRYALAGANRTEQAAALEVLVRAVDLAPSQPSLYGPALNAAQALGDIPLRDRLLAQLAVRDPEWYARMMQGH